MAPEKMHFRPTEAVIELAAFRENLRALRHRLPDHSRLVAVLKADAYGHGAIALAEVCEQEDLPMIAVALVEEAIELRRSGITIPILVLGELSESALGTAVELGITPSISSPEALVCASTFSRARDLEIHLQLDSGMNRMGLIPSDLDSAIDALRASPRLRIGGIFSHYANASTPDDPFNATQRERFDAMLARLRDAGITTGIHHFANSAAIVTGQVAPGDWVRAGISLYGGEPLDAGESRLRPVMRWITRIERLKTIDRGEIVGYGKSWRAERESTIATLPVGYADGYDRLLSGRAEVLVRGQRAPLAGRVSMDLLTVDVTDVPGVEVGDEVVLLGQQGDESIRAEELAGHIGTIPYEIFTNVSSRVPRRHVE